MTYEFMGNPALYVFDDIFGKVSILPIPYNPKHVPVACDMTGNDGRKYAVVRWMDNMDSFWTAKHGGRGISR